MNKKVIKKASKKMKVSYGLDDSSADESLLAQLDHMKSIGATNTEEFKQKTRELEILLGVDTINPFGTNELDIFEDDLKSMPLADMRRLAEKIGINSMQDRPTLKTILINEFKASNRNNRRNIMPNTVNSVILDPNNPVHAEALKILGDI
jgi:hypothetical protein